MTTVSVETLLQEGWAYHDSNSSGLAVELEAIDLLSLVPDNAALLLKLSNHTIGEHLGDWPRACVLARKVWQQVSSAQPQLSVASAVYVAEQLDGDPNAAAGIELAALGALDLNDPLAVISVNLQCKALLAAALIGSGSLIQGATLYGQVVEIARGLKADLSCDRTLAITSNNLAGELLAVEPRSQEQSNLLLASAAAALDFWQRCGTWLNTVRGLYLLQNVHNALGDYPRALACGEQALAMLVQHAPEPVDEAFVLLSMAASQGQLGSTEPARLSLAQADALAALWDDASLRSWFAEERRKVEASSETTG